MSIYRKIAKEAPSDVTTTTVTRQFKRPEASATGSEDPEKSKKRKAAPMDAPLPRTFTWIAKLPREVQPIELMRSYARIANVMATIWNEPDAMSEYFDELLVDRRGNRKGFPPDVTGELLKLRAYYVDLHPLLLMSIAKDVKRR